MRTIGMAVAALALAGCGNDFLLTGSGANGGDDVFANGACAKIEGAQIGEENVTLTIGSKSIRFFGWIAKEGEPGEFIGFSIETSGSLVTRVKAGTETYPVDSSSWVNAAQDGNAVSNVESCDPDDPNNDDPNDDNPDDPTGGTTDPTDPGTGDPPDFT